MKDITPETAIGEIVRALPARALDLEHLGLDGRGSANQSLAEACRERGLDPALVAAALLKIAEEPIRCSSPPCSMPEIVD